MKYPLPTLSAVSDGALIDARMRLAMSILVSPNFINDSVLRAQDIGTAAEYTAPEAEAFGIAERFFHEAEARGWIEPLPDSVAPTPAEIDHVKRNAHAQVVGQLHAQKVANSEQPSVQPAVFTPGPGPLRRQ